MKPREGCYKPLRKKTAASQEITQKTSDALPHDRITDQATTQRTSDALPISEKALQNELNAMKEMLGSMERELQSVRKQLQDVSAPKAVVSETVKEALSEKAPEIEQAIAYQLNNRMTALNSKSAALDSKIDSVRDRLTNLENSQASELEKGLKPIRTEMEKLKKSCQEMLNGSQWKAIERNLVSVQELQNNILSESGEIRAARLHEKKKETAPSGKIYITWTAVFAFLLIVSAMFMTGGMSDFALYRQLKIATILIFCLSVAALIVANFLTASANDGVFASKSWRIWYYCVCGALVLTAFTLSFIVLLV